MKKIIFKFTKAVIAAAAVCAVLALGTLCSSSGSDKQTIVATRPNFIIDVY